MNPLPVSTSVHYIYSGLHCKTAFKFQVVFLPFNLTDGNIIIASYWHMFKRGREGCEQSGSQSLFNKDHLMKQRQCEIWAQRSQATLGEKESAFPHGGNTFVIEALKQIWEAICLCYLALLNVNSGFKNIFIKVKINVLQRRNIHIR